MKTIKIKLLELNKKQVDLLAEIRKRGYPNLAASQLNVYINHPDHTAQCTAVLKLVHYILEMWAKERKAG